MNQEGFNAAPGREVQRVGDAWRGDRNATQPCTPQKAASVPPDQHVGTEDDRRTTLQWTGHSVEHHRGVVYEPPCPARAARSSYRGSDNLRFYDDQLAFTNEGSRESRHR